MLTNRCEITLFHFLFLFIIVHGSAAQIVDFYKTFVTYFVKMLIKKVEKNPVFN